MHYISATRKKSCAACVKSKRRCDLELPTCKRCRTKGLACTYPPISACDNQVAARPDLPVKVSPARFQLHHNTHVDPLFFQFSTDKGSSKNFQGKLGSPLYADCGTPEPRISRDPWTHDFAPSILSDEQVQYIISGMRAFVPAMAGTGSTQFLHPNLWDYNQPEAYQDCVAISSLYLCKTSRNKSILVNNITSKITGLIATSSSWTLSEHLAAVQALIIYQIICLFDPDLNQQATANEYNALLELWAAHLWKRSFNEPHTFINEHDAWVFKESLRRTVMMSVFTRCGWSCMTRGGLADQVPVLARLPLTRDLSVWNRTAEDWPPSLHEQEALVAYGDFSHTWTHDQDVGQLDPFSKLLLAACRGADDPRLLA